MTESKVEKRRTGTERFEDILDAAAKVFRQKGYYHATISDIAREVGLQKGSLYHHIKSKEDLLYHITMYGLQLYIRSLKDIATSDERPDILLKKAIVAHMEPMDITVNRVYVFVNERSALSEGNKKEVDYTTHLYEKMWLNIIERGKEEGLFRENVNSKITLMGIFGMMNWTLRWFDEGKEYSATEVGRMYAGDIVEGLRR